MLVVLYDGLRDTGMAFEGCSVQIVDEGKGCFAAYGLRPNGVRPKREGPLADSAVYKVWRSKQPVYRRSLDTDDEYTELKHVYESHAPAALDWFGPEK